MGLFSKKNQDEVKPAPAKAEVVIDKKVGQPVAIEKKSTKKTTAAIKGTSAKAYAVLLKPLITEKASELGAFNKYVFAIDPSMNKIDVQKAIKTVYKVEPVSVNILNFSGKAVRYGRVSGKMKNWKKAIVTLKQGDSIQVYEGV